MASSEFIVDGNSNSSGTAESISTFNELDEFGLLLDLPRLPSERNPEYKQRLMTVFSQRASSTYKGLIYGITRGLGLDTFNAIEVEPTTTGGSFDATDPVIVFSESQVYLYEDFSLGEDGLDMTIDRYDKNGDAFHLIDLVSEINSSSYFSASLDPDVHPYTRSMTILNQSSRVIVPAEDVPQETKFQLENKNLVKNTVFFSDRTVFKTEVASVGAITNSGDFYIDYKNGIVTTKDVPRPDTAVRYEYRRIPMKCEASPVILHNLQDDDFKKKIFEQVTDGEGETQNGIPTSVGLDLINELYTVFPLFFAE